MFGTLSYITRSANELGMGAFSFVAWRGAIGTVAVFLVSQLAVMRMTRAGTSAPAWLPARRGRALVVACLLGAVVNIAMFAAFLQTTVAVALIAFYTFPALVTLAAVAIREIIAGEDGLPIQIAEQGQAVAKQEEPIF